MSPVVLFLPALSLCLCSAPAAAQRHPATKAVCVGTDSVIVARPNLPPGSFTYIDQMPRFPGNLDSFIRQYLVIPDSATGALLPGTALVSFIVDTTGRLQEISLLQADHPEFGVQTLRLVRSMPPWLSAWDQGRKVPVRYTLRIPFRSN